MTVNNYLETPTVWRAAQWNGTDASDMTDVLDDVGWSWRTDPDGTGHALTPTGGAVPIDIGAWIATGGGSIQFLTSDTFPHRFTPGSAWAVAP